MLCAGKAMLQSMHCNKLTGKTMAYLNKSQTKMLYNIGALDELKTQLVRYGTIHKVTDWEITDIERYNGAHRLYQIEHHGIQWEIEMHNGEVTGISHTVGDHKFW